MKRLISLVLFALLAFGAAACGEDMREAGEFVPNVGVALGEWSITPTPASVPAGLVRFTASNGGPEDPHEVVIFKTDLPVQDLLAIARTNTDERGFLPEEGVSGVEFIAEIEEFDVGQAESGEWFLAAGRYVLLCNIVDADEIGEDGHPEAHFPEGMWAEFFVT
jgi:uncharacterized cupredoxin-like copper-binding protein